MELHPDLATTIALAPPDATWSALTPSARAELADVLERARSSAPLAPEIAQVRDQITALAEIARRRASG
jgi:hypothetical protein